jgi:hypothetical protein
MPKEVANALLKHKRSLTPPQWESLKSMFTDARVQGCSAEVALILAETRMGTPK